MLNQEKHNSKLVLQNNLGAIFTEEQKYKFLSKNIQEYVLSSSDTHLVKDFVNAAFAEANIKGLWVGEGINEKFLIACNVGEVAQSGVLVQINPKFYRPLDVTYLYGDSSKIKSELGWNPKFTYKDIIKEMVEYDISQT